MFHFDLANIIAKIEELEQTTAEPSFWDDPTTANEIIKKLTGLKTKRTEYDDLVECYEDLVTMIELAEEEADGGGLIQEITGIRDRFEQQYTQLRLKTLLNGEYDSHNAILSLHAGAGGTEACDWVGMLYRMYQKWADKRNYKLEVLDYLDGEEAGIKSITFQITGENVYGYIKSEKGVHRLVRISPFDSSGRRHTSFASCDVIPELDDAMEVEVLEEDIRIDTYRASGAGGQHINKTDSAIRITHLPTGVVVQCQNERSQHKNKDKAMAMLKSKLAAIMEEERLAKVDDIRGEMKEIGWGSQIRSYVMHPYSMVKDHRNNVEIGNVGSVMNGDIDLFINEYLIWRTSKKNK